MYLTHMPFDASGMIVPLNDPRGQKRKVLPADCLGLVLVWTQTRGFMNVLQLVFGLTYTKLSVYLQFGICLIVEIYGDDPLARVSLPSAEDIATYRSAFGKRHPLLNDCWAMMDGLKLYLQALGNLEIQEQYYNRWTHDHYVTYVFCFCPDGTIPIAFLMSPDQYMIVRWRRWVRFIRNWRRCMKKKAANVVLTWHFLMPTGSTFTSRVKTCWDHRLLPKLRGRWNCKKKRGNIGEADSGVGDVDNADILPEGAG